MWLKGLFAEFYESVCSLIPLMGAKSVIVHYVVQYHRFTPQISTKMFIIEMHMYSYITSSNKIWIFVKEKAKILSASQIVLNM